MKTVATTDKPVPLQFKVGQKVIPIYFRPGDGKRRKNGAYVFRIYEAGRPRLVERTTLADAKKEATRRVGKIESGQVNAGDLTAADGLSYLHAVKQLEKLGDSAAPLHVALAEYVAAKQVTGEVPLQEVARGYLRTHPAAVGGLVVPIAETIERFLVSVGDRAKNPRYLRGLRCDLGAFAAAVPVGLAMGAIEPEFIRTYLRGLKVGPRRRDNVRNELVSLFRYAKTNNVLPQDRNTAPELVDRLGSTHEITFYRPEQLQAFFGHVREQWIPWLALGAFAGIRSTEIVGDPEDPTRPRLKWEDFIWNKNQIIVPGSTARKIKRARRVPLRPNLAAWLAPWRHATGPIYPDGSDQLREILRLVRRTKIEWNNNALRHSYGTHRNAELHNAAQVAEEMGTSITMIRRHYDAVPAQIDPEKYFGVMPARGESSGSGDGNIIPMVPAI